MLVSGLLRLLQRCISCGKLASASRLFCRLLGLVPGGGVEPPRPEGRRILSPLRLPVPPSRRGETTVQQLTTDSQCLAQDHWFFRSGGADFCAVPVSHSCCSASYCCCSPRYACALLDCEMVSYT